MLKIAVFGDIHDHQPRLCVALDLLAGKTFDLALLAGDIGVDPPFDEEGRQSGRAPHDASVRRTVNRVAEALGCPVLFVPGNHDLPDPAARLRGTNCDGRFVEAAGLSVAGFGGAGPSRFGFPYEWSERSAGQVLKRLLGESRRPDILLSHSPPRDCRLDRTARGEHVGSKAVRTWVRRARPALVVCGHIHEASGVDTIEGVPCLNAGGLGEPHGESIVWTVDWAEEGPAQIESHRRPEGGETARRPVELSRTHRAPDTR